MKHSQSESHKLAIKIEADLAASKRDGGIGMALQQVVSAQESISWGFEVYVFFS